MAGLQGARKVRLGAMEQLTGQDSRTQHPHSLILLHPAPGSASAEDAGETGELARDHGSRAGRPCQKPGPA